MTQGHGVACRVGWVGRKLAPAATRRSLLVSRFDFISTRRRMPYTSAMLSRPALILACLLSPLGAASCSGPEQQPTQFASGHRTIIAVSERNVVSIVPPLGAAIADRQTWAWLLANSRGLVLRVHRAPEPDGGADKYVDSLLAALGKSGQADVETDERIKLSDLDARMIHAVELRNTPVMALWMVLTVAEDGLYMASAYGERETLLAQQQGVRAFLLSLRVESRDKPPAQPIRKIDGDDVEPPAELTQTTP